MATSFNAWEPFIGIMQNIIDQKKDQLQNNLKLQREYKNSTQAW